MFALANQFHVYYFSFGVCSAMSFNRFLRRGLHPCRPLFPVIAWTEDVGGWLFSFTCLSLSWGCCTPPASPWPPGRGGWGAAARTLTLWWGPGTDRVARLTLHFQTPRDTVIFVLWLGRIMLSFSRYFHVQVADRKNLFVGSSTHELYY